jgi:hypothetical protein
VRRASTPWRGARPAAAWRGSTRRRDTRPAPGGRRAGGLVARILLCLDETGLETLHRGLSIRVGARTRRPGVGRLERGEDAGEDRLLLPGPHDLAERHLQRPDVRRGATQLPHLGFGEQPCLGDLRQHLLGGQLGEPRRQDGPPICLRAGTVDELAGHGGTAIHLCLHEGGEAGTVLAAAGAVADAARRDHDVVAQVRAGDEDVIRALGAQRLEHPQQHLGRGVLVAVLGVDGDHHVLEPKLLGLPEDRRQVVLS